MTFLFAALLLAAPNPISEVSVYVFFDDLPEAGATVRLGEQQLITDGAGHVFAQHDNGRVAIEVLRRDSSIATHSLDVCAGDPVRLVVQAWSDGRPAQIEVEGTVEPGCAPAVVTETVAPAQERGWIHGVVMDVSEDEPVLGAKVFVSGVPTPATTDEQGQYRMPVAVGTHSVSVLRSGFNTATHNDVVVKGGMGREVNFELTPAGVELGEFTVSAPHIEGSLASVFDARRESSDVVDLLGADQMSRSGAGDAADALKRVTGLTVVGGRYVYVRGLGERYSTTLLNGMMLPSPDPTRRVVPLDLFPTDILGSVLVQKTYTPTMGGDFSGGTVSLRTRGVPEEGFFKVSLSTGANTLTTGSEGLSYSGGSIDFLGIDDGGRSLPARVRKLTNNGKTQLNELTDVEREQAGEAFANTYDTHSTTLLPDLGLELSLGERFGDDDTHVGFLIAGLYDNGVGFLEEERARLALDGDGGVVAYEESTLQRTERTVDLGGIVDVAAQLGKNHEVEVVGLISRKTDDAILLTDGFLSGDKRDQRTTNLVWTEQEIASVQLRGEHLFEALADLHLEWQGSYAYADRYEPDARQYRYARRRFPGIEPDPFELAATTALGRNPMERSFESLHDTAIGYQLDATLPLTPSDLFDFDVKAGASHSQSDREAEILRYKFQLPSPPPERLAAGLAGSMESILGPDNIGPGLWELINANQGSDSYTGSHSINAGYLLLDAHIGGHVDVMAGVRIEDSSIEVRTAQLINPDETDIARLAKTDVLPAVTATWHVFERLQLRLGFSQTLNRPQLKELSPVPFTDPETRFVRRGNSDLDQASIQNYDARAEWYWTETEGVSAAVFYKSFADPIERVVVGGGPNGEGIREYDNVDGADNLGVELESRWGLGGIAGVLAPLTVAANLSWVDSSVTMGEEQAKLLTSKNRPLQGQSPWVVNAQLEYRNEDLGLDATLLFNVWGERIFDVGVKGLPDAYEQPAPLMDAVVSHTFMEGGKLTFKAKNILNPTHEVTQGDGVLREFRRGISFSLSASYDYAL